MERHASCLRFLPVVLAMVLAVLALSGTARAETSYLTTRGELSRVLAEIVDEVGRTPPIHSIRIEKKSVTVRLQGENRPTDIDEWTMLRNRRFLFEFEFLRGPRPHNPTIDVADVQSGFFDLSILPMDKATAIIAAAMSFAKLDDPATVTSVDIARQIGILPAPSYGDVRWTIYLTTGRETASVTTDAAGNILYGDLSNTNRARRTNFLNEDEWPKEKAISDLIAVLGEGRRVRDMTIYDKSVQLTVDHETLDELTQGYSWTFSGVESSGIPSRLFPGTGDEQLFSLRDVDLSGMAKAREAARLAWGNPQARLLYMMVRRAEPGPTSPELRWVARFTDLGGTIGISTHDGSVELSLDGKVRVVNLPESRRPKVNWLEPDVVGQTLARIASDFGPQARFGQISFNAERSDILAEDPNTPGAMAEFLLDGGDIKRFGTPMPWQANADLSSLFTVADLAFFTPEKLTELRDRTKTRLGSAKGELLAERYTFAVNHLMVPSRDGKVTLEIRFTATNNWDGGRITYSSTGEEIDVVMP